jgi:hypothetical protein
MAREIDHSRWDPSWPVPTADDIDDLEDLGFVRTHPTSTAKRSFALTPSGRSEGETMSGGTQSLLHGGRPPNLSDTLSWLAKIEREAPECFDEPARLIDRAIADGFIAADARERFA